MYVGITQILGHTMTLFGYYMFFVGCVMLWMYKMTSEHIAEMRSLLKDDSAIEAAFNEVAGIEKVLNREKLTELLHRLKIELNHAELEMMLAMLDPDHDGYISLDEIKAALSSKAEEEQFYTIGPVPKMDPSRGDEISFKTKKSRDAGGKGSIDLSKMKRSI